MESTVNNYNCMYAQFMALQFNKLFDSRFVHNYSTYFNDKLKMTMNNFIWKHKNIKSKFSNIVGIIVMLLFINILVCFRMRCC